MCSLSSVFKLVFKLTPSSLVFLSFFMSHHVFSAGLHRPAALGAKRTGAVTPQARLWHLSAPPSVRVCEVDSVLAVLMKSLAIGLEIWLFLLVIFLRFFTLNWATVLNFTPNCSTVPHAPRIVTLTNDFIGPGSV